MDASDTNYSSKEAKFNDIVLPLSSFLLKHCHSLTPTVHDAEDLWSISMTQAWRYIESFDGRFPKAWLISIAKSKAYSKARWTAARPKEVLLGNHSEPRTVAMTYFSKPYNLDYDSHLSAEEQLLESEIDQTTQEAFYSLSQDHRQVLLLAVNGFNSKEAAEILKVAKGTVHSRMSRAREAFKEALEAS